MDLQLKGKNALILGGTRGIGRAIADTLAKEGANVGVCARNAEQVAATVTELKALGVKAAGASVDVTYSPGPRAMGDLVDAALGRGEVIVSVGGRVMRQLSAGGVDEIIGVVGVVVHLHAVVVHDAVGARL